MTTRRHFLLGCSAAALAPAFGRPAPAGTAFRIESFRGDVGRSFTLADGRGGFTRAVLRSAQEHRPLGREDLVSPLNFTLQFESAASDSPEDDLLTLHHPVLGDLPLHFVRHVERDSTHYVATFYGSPVLL